MQTVYSVEMQLPDDKLPGYYSQIVKGIADVVTLIDRDKTMLFVKSGEDADAIEAFTAKYKVQCERGTWLHLDEPGWHPNPQLFTDYGIVTRSDNHFLDLQLAAIVSFSSSAPDDELASALEQASEHAIADLTTEDGRKLIAVDRHQVELMEGIARAYRCSAELIL